MADYTKLTLDEAAEILKLYTNVSIRNLKALSLGISNSNYKVELIDGETLLLKVSNDKGVAELSDEQRILKHLEQEQFTYSICSVPLISGEQVYKYGEYFGVIFPFVAGIPPGPSDSTCFEIGKALAELHQLNFDEAELRDHEQVGFGIKQISDYTQSNECPSDFKELFINFFSSESSQFIEQEFSRGIIHGDLYYDNTLFHNDKLNKILDFEQAGIGELILDLGISISGCCLEKENIHPPLVESYLKGYESVRSLDTKEKAHISDAIILGLFSIALWRIKRFKVGKLNPLMADSYKRLLDRAKRFQKLNKEYNEN